MKCINSYSVTKRPAGLTPTATPLPEGVLLKKQEIARYYRVTNRTIEHWVREGRLSCIRIGRTVRFKL